MRLPWLIGLALAFVSAPALCAPAPTIALSSPTAQAGQPLTFTITRSGAMQGIYVLFSTADGSAKAGTDYTATSQLIYLKGGQTSATVTVPTLLNPAASGTLSLNAAVADSAIGVHVVASIVEPAAAPPVVQPTLTELGQSWCPTATSLCHTKAETPLPSGWAEAQIVAGGYALPLGWIYCAGAIVKLEALDANAYLDAASLTDSWGNVYTQPTDGSRLWAVHFVNEGGTQCAATGQTVVFMERDLEGIVQVQ